MMWRGLSFLAVILVITTPVGGFHARFRGIFSRITSRFQTRYAPPPVLPNDQVKEILNRVTEIQENQETCSKSCTDNLVTLDNGYLLAFRVTPGIQSSSYTKFIAEGKNDDTDCLVIENVPEGCKTTDGRLPCDRHYRSSLLDLWDRLPIARVRVGIYKDNVEERFFEFNGKGSTFENWFSQSRLINNSYTDLSATVPNPNYFSIAGDNAFGRSFFINNNYGGCGEECDVDSGWLMVSDTQTPFCPWETPDTNASFPYIFFSGTDTLTVYNTQVALGDTLVISVKLDNTQ